MSQELLVFLTLREVVAAVKRCRSTVLNDIKKGTFPAPFKTGARSIAFSAAAVREWQESRIQSSKTI